MTDSACTFSAVGGPMYETFQNITKQSGCCVTDGTGTVQTAYGLNNTCHLLEYTGNAAPYRLTLLEKNTGELKLSTGQCVALILEVQDRGEFSTGDGKGPADAGLASTYGYTGCVVGASSNPDEASSKKSSATSAAALGSERILQTRHLLLLATVLSLFLL